MTATNRTAISPLPELGDRRREPGVVATRAAGLRRWSERLHRWFSNLGDRCEAFAHVVDVGWM